MTRSPRWPAGPAAQASLDDPQAVAGLLRRLRAAGADEMAQILISRVGTQARPDDPQAVEWLLRTLRVLGPDAAIVLPSWGNAVAALASRAAAQASLDDPLAIAELLSVLDEAGDEDAVTILLARDPAAHTSLDDLRGVAELLGALCEAGARDAVSTLANRAAAWPASTTPSLSLSCSEHCARPGPGTRSSRWPTGPPSRSASTTGRLSPSC